MHPLVWQVLAYCGMAVFAPYLLLSLVNQTVRRCSCCLCRQPGPVVKLRDGRTVPEA
jgi:hypothetical protein